MVKSAAIVVPDRDVSFALDTLRSFILKNDPTLMPMMLDLQLKIASVSFFFVVKYLLQFHLNLTFYKILKKDLGKLFCFETKYCW